MDDSQTINILKGLVIDGVDRAKSGHPGGAMSSADFAYILFTEFLRYDPDDATWRGRDRFILSAGHESMLLYSLLHCQGFLELAELKRFRQLHSLTPGHPEHGLTPGVECTTGPLGQGAGMSVGFAIAATQLKASLDADLFTYKTWVLCGDGDMQEDITLGAASLAGHLRLGNLVWYYDQNSVQISGKVGRSCSDDFAQIFRGFGWTVLEVNGHDHIALRAALSQARSHKTGPLLIIGNSTMAKGAHSLEGSSETHGAPLPAGERQQTKALLGIPAGEDFYLPLAARQHFNRHADARRAEAKAWRAKLAERLAKDAAFKQLWHERFEREDFSQLPAPTWDSSKELATRNAFGDLLEKWASALPQLMGGSADLEPSNMTGAFAAKVKDFSASHPSGRNLAFGVREFPMSAISNGLALHGGVIPFDATFLSFADYSRPALRLGALQNLRVIHEFSHDSFHLGEDGPTHQPVEHLMSLRLIPNFYLMRPADAHETEVMLRVALQKKAPSALCLSRQKLPFLTESIKDVEDAKCGAYTILDCRDANLIIIATGSEVHLALATARLLAEFKIKVVSMPCWELFQEQSNTYRKRVIDPKIARVAIEAGSTLGWERWVGEHGLIIGLDHFGASAPAKDLEKEYGFTPEQVAARIRSHSFA